jgi:UDPglucose 6-dehydrogenase
MLQTGEVPIFEPDLDDRISEASSNLQFSNDFSASLGYKAVFLCVPTPNTGNRIDMKYVLSAAEYVKKHSSSSTLVIKSTVLPGTASRVTELTGMNVVSNPEFTRDGSAVRDTEKPDRIVLGGKSVETVKRIWEFTGSPMVVTTNESAELIKYASNAFLAVKISFINQVADLCETIPGVDVNVVAEGMGLDRRIGTEFLKAGLGYGGSCFPKDTVALSSFAENRGIKMSIVNSAVEYNGRRIADLSRRINALSGSLKGKKICVLGLSFKDNTDDMRESRSILIINELARYGSDVIAYDPVVKNVKNVKICDNLDECISSSEIVITATEWKEFSAIDPGKLSGKMVFDLRRVFEPNTVDLKMGAGIGKN